MSGSFSSAKSLVTAASALSPDLGAQAALGAFFNARSRMVVHDRDRATHERARRGTVGVRDLDLVTYEWGRSDQTVLLAHGWRGRASQFATLVRDLVYEGFHVVAFDAPAHGDSPGRRTDLRDWVAAIEQLQLVHGRFRMVVGHSLGALAALTAARGGVTTASVAAISGAGTHAAFIAEFSTAMGLDAATRRHFEAAFRRRIGEDEASFTHNYDANAHPLPAGVPLLVAHDEGDQQLPVEWSARLFEAHAERARFVRTSGYGHSRLLASDPVLDALVGLAIGGLKGVDDALAQEGADHVASWR